MTTTPACPLCGGELEPYQDSEDEFICKDCAHIFDIGDL